MTVLHDSAQVKTQWQKFYDSEMEKVRPTLSQLMDHIDYLTKMGGVDHVGIGSDYDGVESVTVGMDDVTCYPKITKELRQRGYSKKDIRKILGGNVMRVMKANFL